MSTSVIRFETATFFNRGTSHPRRIRVLKKCKVASRFGNNCEIFHDLKVNEARFNRTEPFIIQQSVYDNTRSFGISARKILNVNEN